MKFIDYLNDCLKDPEFKAYWDELEAEESIDNSVETEENKDA